MRKIRPRQPYPSPIQLVFLPPIILPIHYEGKWNGPTVVRLELATSTGGSFTRGAVVSDSPTALHIRRWNGRRR